MGERVRLPDGRIVLLPANITPEERSTLILELKSRFRITDGVVPPAGRRGEYTDLGKPALPQIPSLSVPSAPRGGGAPAPAMGGLPPVPSLSTAPTAARQPLNLAARRPVDPRDPEQINEELKRQRTIGGGIGALLKGTKLGFQQALMLGKLGALGLVSPDEDTKREQETREAMENLILQIDPVYQDSHWAELGMGLGTMGGFIAAPAAATALTASAPVATGVGLLAAGLMGVGEQTDRMARHEEETGEDISGAKEMLAMGMGMGIGFTEMWPAGKLVKKGKRILTGGRRGVAKTTDEIVTEILERKAKSKGARGIVVSALTQAAEEAVQESVAGLAQSVTAKHLYDEDALVGSTARFLKEGMLGGEVGFIADALLSLADLGLGGRRRRQYERFRAASGRIGTAHRQGVSEGTINDGINRITERNENGDFVDQSPESVKIREDARLRPDSVEDGTFTSDTRDMAAKVQAESMAAIDQQLKDGEITEEESLVLKAELAERFKILRGQVLLLGGILAEIDTGTNPLTKAGASETSVQDASEAGTEGEAEIDRLKEDRARAKGAVGETPDDQMELDLEVEALDQQIEEREEAEAADPVQVIMDKWQQEQDEGEPLSPITEEDVDVIEEASTSKIKPATTYSIEDLRQLVWNALVPTMSYFEDGTKREVTAKLETSEKVLSSLRQDKVQLDRLVGPQSADPDYRKSDEYKQARQWLKARLDMLESTVSIKADEVKGLRDNIENLEENRAGKQAELETELRNIVLSSNAILAKPQNKVTAKDRKDLQEFQEMESEIQAELQILQSTAEVEGLNEAQLAQLAQQTEEVFGEDAQPMLEADELKADLGRAQSELAELHNRFGASKAKREANYLERRMKEVNGLTREVKEGDARQEEFVDVLPMFETLDEETGAWVPNQVSRGEIWKGSDQINTEGYLEEALEAKEAEFFGDEPADLYKVIQTLPFQSQRNALMALQRTAEENAGIKLNPRQVSTVVRDIFTGGINENLEVGYEIQVFDEVEDMWVPVERIKPRESVGMEKPQWVVQALGEAGAEYNKTVAKEDQIKEGSVIDESVQRKVWGAAYNTGTETKPDGPQKLYNEREKARQKLAEASKILENHPDPTDEMINDEAEARKAYEEPIHGARDEYFRAMRKGPRGFKAIVLPQKAEAERPVSKKEQKLVRAVEKAQQEVVKKRLSPEIRASLELRLNADMEAHNDVRDLERSLRNRDRTPMPRQRKRPPKEYTPEQIQAAVKQSVEEKEISRFYQEKETTLAPLYDTATGEYLPRRPVPQRTKEEIELELDEAKERARLATEFFEEVEGGKEATAFNGARKNLSDAERALALYQMDAQHVKDIAAGRVTTMEVDDIPKHMAEREAVIQRLGLGAVRMSVSLGPGRSYTERMVEEPRTLAVTANLEEFKIAGREQNITVNDPETYSPEEVERLKAHKDVPFKPGKLKQLKRDLADDLKTDVIVLAPRLDDKGVSLRDKDGNIVYDVVEGMDLFVAAKETGRQTIHAVRVEPRDVEMAGRVLEEMFDTPTMISLGMWFDENAVDQKINIPKGWMPKTILPSIWAIRHKFLGRQKGYKKGEVTRGLLIDALIAKGYGQLNPRTGLATIGKVNKVVDGKEVQVDFIDELILDTFDEQLQFEDLLSGQKMLLLERVLTGEQDTRPSVKQKPLAPKVGLNKDQARIVLERIRGAGEAGFSVAHNSKVMKQLLVDLNIPPENRGLVQDFVRSLETHGVEFVNRTKVRMSVPEALIGNEQADYDVAVEENRETVEKGRQAEQQSHDEGGERFNSRENPGQQATTKERLAELARAKLRIQHAKSTFRRRALMMFGKKKGEAIVIEIHAGLDSIYAKYVDKISDRNAPAYVDTYTGTLIFNISKLEEMYAEDYDNLMDVPMEKIATNAMTHEGAHVLFLEGIVSPREQRNLKAYGERQYVPKAKDPDAVHPNGTRMTWRQWVESQPESARMNEAEVTEEMYIQILDALAQGLIPGAESAGFMNSLKQTMWNYVRVIMGMGDDGSLSSILSVFDKLQDRTEMVRRMEAAELHELKDLNFASRADPDDLKALMKALDAKDEKKVQDLAVKIAHSRTEGIEEIDPTTNFLNQMRARQEIDETPKGIMSILNGGAIEDLPPSALDEFFSIEDGKPPYVMSKPRRELLGRRRPRALTPEDEESAALAKKKRKGREDATTRDSIKKLTLNDVEGKLLDATPEQIKQVWEYNYKMRFRQAFLDKRLPQALASTRADARKRALGIIAMTDSITAWRYADNSQNFLHALWELGPMELSGDGYRVVRNRTVELTDEVITTIGGKTITLTEGGNVKTIGLAPMFEKLLGDDDSKVNLDYGEALRVLGTRGELDRIRRILEQQFGVDLSKGKLERLGGLRLDKNGKILVKKIKKQGRTIDYSQVVTLEDQDYTNLGLDNLTDEQRSAFDAIVAQIGFWQRKYDIVNPPGNLKVGDETQSQKQRYNAHLTFFETVQKGSEKEGSLNNAVVEFWRNYRAYNSVQIDMAYDVGMINKDRRDLYKKLNFMPFYRDATGWGDASVLENDNSPEAQERRMRRDVGSQQNVADPEGHIMGSPLIDKNIEGSFMPINDDLVGNILKNTQALIRDSMWNNAARATIEDMTIGGKLATDVEAPEAREQVYLQWADLTEADHAALKAEGLEVTEGQKKQSFEKGLSEAQKQVVYHRRKDEFTGWGLLTPAELSKLGFEDLTIRVKIEGEAKYYRTMDSHMAAAVMATGVSPSQTIEKFFMDNVPVMNEKWAKGATRLLVGSSNLLRTMVTLSPVFWNKNVLRDSMQASVTFGYGPRIILSSFKHFFFGELIKDKEGMGSYERAKRAGLAVGIDMVNDPTRAHKEAERLVRDKDLHWDTPLDLVSNLIWRGPVKFLKRGAAQSEIATRLAVYDRVMKDTGGNEAQAFKAALEIINFGRRGANPLFSAFTAMSPFMNGRIQGLDVTWRTHIGSVDVPGLYLDEDLRTAIPDEALSVPLQLDEEGKYMVALPSDYSKLMRGGNRGRRAMRAFQRGSVIMSATLLYLILMYDEDEYKNARESDKNNYWIMPWGLKIPIPFEVGTIYKVIPEQLFRWAMDQTHDVGDVGGEVKRQIMTSLALDLRPQLFRNAIDAAWNIDRYQKDAIVPSWMEDDLLSPYQMRDNTSYVARGISKTMSKIPMVNWMDWVSSPMAMEYFLRQQFGTMFAYGIVTADAIWAWSHGLNRAGSAFNFGVDQIWAPFTKEGGTVAEEWNRLPMLGDLFFDPRQGGGWQEDFYGAVETLDAIVTTLGQISKDGSDEARNKAQKFERQYDYILKHKDQLRHWETQMDHWRDDRDAIKADNSLTREEKTRMLVRKMEERDNMLSGMEEIMARIRTDRSFLDALAEAWNPK